MNNDPNANDGEARLSETDVRRILERAIQIDSVRTNEVTLAELRRVADEVGISPVALLQAFEENQLAKAGGTTLTQPVQPVQRGWLSRARRMLRPVWLASVASVLGIITAAGGAEEPALATFFATIAGSLVLAILHRLRRRDAVEAAQAGFASADQLIDARNQGWTFQIDLLAIWAPWSILNGLAEADLFAVGSLAWTVAALIGMGIVVLWNPTPRVHRPDIRSGTPEAAVSGS